MTGTADKVYVTELRADDWLRLRAVRLELAPVGGMTVLGGRNGQGKSSVLGVIEAALGGGGRLPARPVREGADKGSVAVTLSDGLVVERTFTAAGGTQLKVSKDGMQASSPQGRLDALLGPLSFDPLEFDRLKDGDKAERVRQLAGLDLSDLDAERRRAYDGRTDVGRIVRQKEGELAGLPPADPDAPEAAPDLAALTGAFMDAQAAHGRWAGMQERAEALGRKAAALAQELVDAQRELTDAKAAARQTPEPDVGHAQRALQDADALARRFQAAVRRKAVEAALLQARHDQAGLTGRIRDVDAERDARIKAAALPVDGLGFDPETGLLVLDGLPYAQASQARRLRASLAIAEAMHPALRILLMREGSNLDDAGLHLVAQWARDKDMHVLIERVQVDGLTGIVIEDGEISIPEKPKLQLPGRKP